MALGIPTTNHPFSPVSSAPKPQARMTGGPTIGGVQGYPGTRQTDLSARASNLNGLLAQSNGSYGNTFGPTASQYGTAYQTGLDFYSSLAQTQAAQIAQQQDRTRFGIGLNEAGLATDSGIMRGLFGDDMAKLGFDNQRRGIERNDLLAQLGGLNKDMGFADERFGLANKGFDIDERGARRGAEINTRNTKSQAIPRDASTSEFTRLRLADTQNELANQLGGIGLGRQGADLTRREKKAQIEQQKASTDAALKTLDTRAAEAGLDASIYKRKLEEGLQKLSLDSRIGVQDLMMALESGDIENMMLAEKILAQANAAVPYFMANPVTRSTSTTSTSSTPSPRPERIGSGGMQAI